MYVKCAHVPPCSCTVPVVQTHTHICLRRRRPRTQPFAEGCAPSEPAPPTGVGAMASSVNVLQDYFEACAWVEFDTACVLRLIGLVELALGGSAHGSTSCDVATGIRRE